jgi:two-component system sensor histidine kinase PhoQ
MNVSPTNLRQAIQADNKTRLSLLQTIKSSLEKMSLAKRMFISSTLVLLAFLGAAALMLNSLFSISLESIVQEKLTLHTYQLLSIGDSDNGLMQLPEQLAEPRFNQRQGSLIAFVTELTQENQQQEVWRSLSATDKQFSFPPPGSGQWAFGRAQGADGSKYYVSSYNTTWSNSNGVKSKYIFTVMEDLSYYQKELAKYRVAIVIGLLLFGLIFLLLQTIILRLGLSPVRRITADVEAMNNGDIHSLTGQYPKELRPLTTNLNLLIDNERHQRERYRDRMADLSHSLKTPLSVLRGVESDIDSLGRPITRQNVLNTLSKQVGRMTEIVDYQLQRAISNGAPTVFSAINVADKANDILSALNRVYANENIASELNIDQELSF